MAALIRRPGSPTTVINGTTESAFVTPQECTRPWDPSIKLHNRHAGELRVTLPRQTGMHCGPAFVLGKGSNTNPFLENGIPEEQGG